MLVGEKPQWFGLLDGDDPHVSSTSAHALEMIESVREEVDKALDVEEDPELAAAFDVALEELSAGEETDV